MGIRRRRKKINTILSTIDRRLKTVETQRVPRVVKDGTITKKMLSKEVTIALDSGSDAATNNPGSSAPKPPTFRTQPFTNIVKIIYRGYNETDDSKDRDRARVYFASDPGLNVGDKIKFASLTGSLDVPTKTAEYTVQEVSVVDGYNTIVYYPGRATIVDGTKTYDKSWRVQDSNVSVTGAIVNGDTTTYKYGQIIVNTKDATPSTNSDYLYGPTWPAGIETTEGLHFTGGNFSVGNLLNLDGLGSPFDGTHKITYSQRVGTQITIQFEFKEYPTAPVQLPSSNGVIRGAAGRYLRDGETWTDTTVEPSITWIWDDQRQKWWNAAEGGTLPEGVVVDDGIPPSPPTSLSGTSTGYTVGKESFSKVNLTWTAPTTNSNGTNLSDLKGYAVYYRYSTNEDWKFFGDSSTTSIEVNELIPRRNAIFAVKAFDLTRNLSEYSQAYTILTVAGSATLDTPSAPVATSRLGQIQITWDGLDSAGATPDVDKLSYVEVHQSSTSGFTPSSSTNKGRIYGKNDFFLAINPSYSTTHYFKFIFIDISGNNSTASAQTSATVAKLVDDDLIADSLTRWPFGENTVNTNSLADGSLSATYLVSGNDADGTAVRIEGKIAAGSIGATSIAANSIVAGKIAANAVTANTIEAGAIKAGKIDANAVTTDTIEAGAITGIKIAARSITGQKILATTTLTFASYDDGNGNPGSSSDQVIIGNHVVSGYGGNVTVTGLSFYRSGVRSGILGAGTWAAMSFGADEISNALQYTGDDSGGYNAYLRVSSGGLTISTNTGTSVFGGLAAYGMFYSNGGARLLGPVELMGGRIEVVRNPFIPATVGFRIFDTNPAVFGIWADETYRETTGSSAAVAAALLHANTSTMTLRTKNVVVTSTRESKEDINSYPTDYRILDISPKTFRYKSNENTKLPIQLGLIAEEVDDLGLDMIVVRDDETGKPAAIDYMKIPVLLAPIVKELQDRISKIESRMKE